MGPSKDEFIQVRAALTRFNARVLASAFAFMVAVGVAGATLLLVAKGGPNVGQNMGLLGQYLPGYSVSVPGAMIGFLWVFVFGIVLSYGPAWIYYRGALGAAGADASPVHPNELLRRSARIHVPSFAVAAGLFFGSVVLLATLWLILRHEEGEPLGPHLTLLGHYLPGYAVSVTGAFVGFGWMLLHGIASFSLIGLLYNRLIGLIPSRVETRDAK